MYTRNNGCQWFVCVGIQFQIVLVGSVPQNQIKLLPTRWNKDVVGAWRLDLLPIDVEDTSDNESDRKTGEGGSEMRLVMAMVTVSVVQLPLPVVVARYV